MAGRGKVFEENVAAITAAGGAVDIEWLDRASGLAGVEKARSGAETMTVELPGGRKIHLHSAMDPVREARRAIEASAPWEGRHAVIYGAGCGHHAAAAAAAGAAVTLLESNPDCALAALEHAPLAQIAETGACIFMGPGRKILPPALARIRELEHDPPRPAAKLHILNGALSALPPSESSIRAALSSLREGHFIHPLADDPRTAFAFESLRKRRLRGTPLTGFDLALLFIEASFGEDRMAYTDAEFVHTPRPEVAQRILLISLSSIGDVVTSTTAFDGLREAYPSARIVFLTETPSQTLYERCASIDRVVSYPRSQFTAALQENPCWENLEVIARSFTALVEGLRAENFDAIFNLHTSMRSAAVTAALDPKHGALVGLTIGRDVTPRIHGTAWAHAKLMNRIPPGLPQDELNLRIMGLTPRTRRVQVGVPRGTEGPGVWAPFVSYPGRKTAIGINPCSNIRARMWGIDNYIGLCRILTNYLGHEVVIFGGASEVEAMVVDHICSCVGKKAIPCVGIPPDEAAWAARECALFITNDTGPMHFAGAAGARCLIIAGPSLTIPYTQLGHIAVAADMPCIFCGPLTRCETGECMANIEPSQVASLAAAMLEHGAPGALALLAGLTSDGRFPHPLFTSGTYTSNTPRFFMRLRDKSALETHTAAEWVRIAAFNAMMLLDADALLSRAHPAGLDHPGLASPFSPDTAFSEVMRRHGFYSPDITLLTRRIDAALQWFTDRDASHFPPEFSRMFTPLIVLDSLLAAMESPHAEDALSYCRDFLSNVRSLLSRPRAV